MFRILTLFILFLNCRNEFRPIDDFTYVGMVNPHRAKFDLSSCNRGITETKVSTLPPNQDQQANSFSGTTQAIIKINCNNKVIEVKMKYHSIGLDDELISLSNGNYTEDIYRYRIDSPGTGALEFIGANSSDIYFSISKFNVLGLIIGDELVRPIFRLSLRDFSLYVLE